MHILSAVILVFMCLVVDLLRLCPVQGAEERDELISELRSKVEGLKVDSILKTNETLFRYLLQSKSNVQEALQRIQKTAEWRKITNVNLLALDDVSLLKVYLPYECTGTTETGNPVFYLPLGKWDLRRVQRNRQNARLQSHIIQLFENSLRAASKEINPQTQEPSYQSIFIVDLQGLTLRQLFSGYGRTLSTLIRTSNLYQNHYPHTIKKIYIIRSPQHFRLFWLLARRFAVDSDLVNNVEIYTTFSTRWRNDIRKSIPKDAIPKNLRL